MALYKATVVTGDMLAAGTWNSMSLQLIGTKGSSPKQLLRNSGYRDSDAEYDIKCLNTLGDVFLVKLAVEPHFLSYVWPFWPVSPKNDWFCSKVMVTTPEGQKMLFPCYTWVSHGNALCFREATAVLRFNDTLPEAVKIREEELKYRKEAYKWSEYADGLPQSVNVDSPLSLPKEVQFSFTKTTEFLFTAASAAAELKLEGYTSTETPWQNMEQIDQVFRGKKSETFQYVEKHWREDEFFGYQFLNGLNPMMVQRCSNLPENFPVTEDMVKDTLQASLQEEMKAGNIFLVDYKRMDGLSTNVVNKKKQYVAAPLVLLHKTPDDKLIPIAIQLKQEPGPLNPIFFPTDSEYDWLLAKIFVRSADFVEHELNFHLLRTHLLSEVFTMATLRNMPMVHPLYKLLMPHFRYTLQIDTMARSLLISPDGVFTKFVSVGADGMKTYLDRAVSSLTYSSLCIKEDIAARGLEEVPNFYYRDDGFKLWDLIFRFVTGVVGHYYPSDSDVQKDSELQNWMDEVFVFGFLANNDSGIPRELKTVPELIKFLTVVIFTASAQHAAVNNGQFDFDGWMPNSPITLQLPPPVTKGQSSESTMLATFPDVNVTAQGMATVYLLSRQSTDYVPLGDFKEDQFSEEKVLQIIEEFQTELEVFHYQVKARNVRLPLPYIYLNPENVENSVAI